MKITVTKNSKSNVFNPFIGEYDAYVSYDEDSVKNVLERDSLTYSENLDFEKLSTLINFSWDGEVYFFPHNISKKIEGKLSKWFLDSQNHEEVVSLEDTQGVFNFILVKRVERGLYVIDTQRDMNSTFPNFIDELDFSDDDYEFHSDCHMIDNIYLGRNDLSRDITTFKNWYKDGVINESFFFHGEDLEEVLESEGKINILTRNPELLSMIAHVSDQLDITANSTQNDFKSTWYDNTISENELKELVKGHSNVVHIKEGVVKILKNYEDNNE